MSLQSHVHLDTSLTGSPEYSPTLKWVTTDRLDIPEVVMTLRRTLSGKLRAHTLNDASGVPILFQNYQYTIKVQADTTYTLEQRMGFLKAMSGKKVYFCDHFHAIDGADHTTYVREMRLEVGQFPPSSPGLSFFLVDVKLEDEDSA